jgi:cytochrome c-type biogenesis protein CcmH/NrfG
VRQQRKAEALAALKRATELDPSNRRFAYVYGIAQAELGQ